MDLVRLLRGIAVFDGLDEAELRQLAGICREATYQQGEPLTTQGTPGSEVFIIRDGLVEVSVGELGQGELPPHTVVNMGAGQIVGEMSLIDHGPRSATVRCATPTCQALVVEREAFEAVCAQNHRIGMVVYRNLAADLSFKLRHRHLMRR